MPKQPGLNSPGRGLFGNQNASLFDPNVSGSRVFGQDYFPPQPYGISFPRGAYHEFQWHGGHTLPRPYYGETSPQQGHGSLATPSPRVPPQLSSTNPRRPPRDLKSQWEVNAEIARLFKQAEEANHMQGMAAKEDRAAWEQAEIDKETERLRREFEVKPPRYDGLLPPNSDWKVAMKVTILAAGHLQNRHMFRSPVPYVALKVHHELIGRTGKLKSDRNPHWNESFNVSVDRGDVISMLVADTLLDDEDERTLNDRLGSTYIGVDELAAGITHERMHEQTTFPSAWDVDYRNLSYREADPKSMSMSDLALNKLICLISD